MSRLARLFVLPVIALGILSSCDPEEFQPNLPLESQISPIVNGSYEYGWPAVGALTYDYGWGQYASFCTGTLIAPQWVLTAGHCLSANDEFTPSPYSTFFFIGNDVNSGGWSGPDGDLYSVDKFYVHPNYSPLLVVNDVALMHLKAPVTNVAPLPMNTTPIDSSFVGEDVFFVGFGVTSGTYQSGGGVKRSTYVPLTSYSKTSFSTYSGTTGTCYGDSGGPGFLNIDGVWKVAGTVSTGGGGSTGDECLGISNQMRVDAYIEWIYSLVDPSAINCQEIPSMCDCEAACTASGTCDNDLCKDLTCNTGFDCVVACDSADNTCLEDCELRVKSDELDLLLDTIDCIKASCGDPRIESALQCGLSICAYEIARCDPAAPGTDSCSDIRDCMVACSLTNSSCKLDCYNAGTLDARDAWDDLSFCFEEFCTGIPGEESQMDCSWSHCASAMDACLPAANCDPAGGDCDAGTACAPNSLNQFDCFPSQGGEQGASCDRNASVIPCSDGLACGNLLGSYVCLPICYRDADCGLGSTCLMPLWEGVGNVGVCFYNDEDGDGVSGLTDCDDTDRSVAPEAEEVCDGKDNDCDGSVDEGCPGVTDPEEDIVSEDDGSWIPDNPLGGGSSSSGSCSQSGTQASPLPLALLLGLLFFLARFWRRSKAI